MGVEDFEVDGSDRVSEFKERGEKVKRKEGGDGWVYIAGRGRRGVIRPNVLPAALMSSGLSHPATSVSPGLVLPAASISSQPAS